MRASLPRMTLLRNAVMWIDWLAVDNARDLTAVTVEVDPAFA